MELRALRERAAALERRLELLEASAAVHQGLQSSRSAPPGLGAGAKERDTTPTGLTVVKLRPRSEPAPKLDTGQAVREPGGAALEQLAEVSASTAAARGELEEDPDLVEAQFKADVNALRTGNVAGATVKLEQFANQHPKHPHADNALYFAGLGLMGLDDYAAAAERFERVAREYPAGDAVADALLKLAECRSRSNKPAEARALYSEVARSYPGTAAANQAQAHLASMTP